MENQLVMMSDEELMNIDGGAIELMIFGKVLTGAAAVAGIAGIAVVGVAILAGAAYVSYVNSR
jgi:hypothetical protein